MPLESHSGGNLRKLLIFSLLKEASHTAQTIDTIEIQEDQEEEHGAVRILLDLGGRATRYAKKETWKAYRKQTKKRPTAQTSSIIV